MRNGIHRIPLEAEDGFPRNSEQFAGFLFCEKFAWHQSLPFFDRARFPIDDTQSPLGMYHPVLKWAHTDKPSENTVSFHISKSSTRSSKDARFPPAYSRRA